MSAGNLGGGGAKSIFWAPKFPPSSSASGPSVALVPVSKQPKCPKVLTESAKSLFGVFRSRVPKEGANPVSHQGKVPEKGFRTVQEDCFGSLIPEARKHPR